MTHSQYRFKTEDDLSVGEKEILAKHDIDLSYWQFCDIKVGYKNWNYNDVLKAILPEVSDGVGGFSTIGHIVHLNLDENLEQYKAIIGDVLIDKVPAAKTVVNKINIIDNTYRNFQMEVLAGEDNLVTIAKEHGLSFQMDFSKVYWNSRLSKYHETSICTQYLQMF